MYKASKSEADPYSDRVYACWHLLINRIDGGLF